MTALLEERDTRLDLEPPCELGDAYKPDCDQPAAWVLHRACCGSRSLGCEGCKEARVMNHLAVECRSCGFLHEYSARAYLMIEPLR